VAIDGGDAYWVEGRPTEGGRNVLVRRRPDGAVVDVSPPGFNVRTRVHEYGGGAYVVSAGEVFLSNFSDQRIYRIRVARGAGSAEQDQPDAVTPAGPWFYADAVVDDRRRRLVCLREDHTRSEEPVNTIVSIPLDPAPRKGAPYDPALETQSAGDVIVAGHDFYSTPRLSPDGSHLSWLAWRHPQMPWDGTELWVGTVTDAGTLTNQRRIAGGDSESIYQPGWSLDGTLYFASDRTGWWNLYRADLSGNAIQPLLPNPPARAEFGRPHWVFGTATWACAGASRLVAAYTTGGRWRLCVIDTRDGSWRDIAAGFEPGEWLASDGRHALLVAGSPTMADTVVQVDLDSEATEVLRPSSTLALDAGEVSVPESIEFATGAGATAHAFYYQPRNTRHATPPGERPPLIAISHGGPTTAASATLDLRIQFWTSRGFAVVDVNYGGSSGYGRPYRERLAGQWGIVDVDDMVNAVRHLVSEGKADQRRLIVRGGSAGGYTTLAALTGRPEVFTAGASYYGVSDIEVLARDTHKFESRYLDRLVGPYPEARDRYRARSPIHHVDRLACPLILFQGLEDKVVPPNQSEMMAAAARANGLPVAYLTFEGEQHGFRKAETIVRCLEAELYFYGAVFGFTPADPIVPVPIDNL
jgi:dipeptidyl aminopeptidase/acylaminoacyl peptidase